MNPYLESDVWHGFHQMFVPACSQALVPQVRPDYIVTSEENVYVHELPDQEDSVPLRDPHPDAVLDLQQLLHSVYDAAGFEDYLYDSQPELPLSPEQASGAAGFLPGGVKAARNSG